MKSMLAPSPRLVLAFLAAGATAWLAIDRADATVSHRTSAQASASMSMGSETPSCGDFSGDDRIAASDALGVLRSAVGTQMCGLCICDVDSSGKIAASDALLVLRKAVGVDLDLICPSSGLTVTWDGGGDGGLWEDPDNWDLDRIPDECDVAVIDDLVAASDHRNGDEGLVVTHGSGDHGVLAVTSTAELLLLGGSLTVRGTLSVDDRLAIANATLSGARIAATESGTVEIFIGTVLDGVVADAPVSAMTTSTFVTVVNGLTVNDSFVLGSNSTLLFSGTGEQVLDGTGEVQLNGSGVAATLLVADEASLRIAADVTVSGKGGRVLAPAGLKIDGTLVGGDGFGLSLTSDNWTNNGTITSEGALVSIGGTGTNAGLISASSGGTVSIDGDWLNTGQISATGATLNLGGASTTSWDNDGTVTVVDSSLALNGLLTFDSIGFLDRTGGSVLLVGILDNSEGFILDDERGDWIIASGGTISGGTVTAMPDQELTIWNGVMDGVTLNTPVNMNVSRAFASFVNGTTLHDELTLGTLAILSIDGEGEQELQGTGSVVLTPLLAPGSVNSTATTLRIGSDMTVTGSFGSVGSGSTNFINDGRIETGVGGNPLNVGAVTCENNGEIVADAASIRLFGVCVNHATLEMHGGRFIQAVGDLTLSSTSQVVIELASAFSTGQLIAAQDIELGGTLTIALAEGFDPEIGQEFTVLTYQSVTGAFGSIDGLDLGGGKALQPTTGATSLTLEVVAP